jgi:hypothetical protein
MDEWVLVRMNADGLRRIASHRVKQNPAVIFAARKLIFGSALASYPDRQ